MLKKYYLFIVFLSFVAAKNEEYRGYKVYNIEVDTEFQQENLGLLRSDLIDFWRKPSYKYGVIGKAMVPPSHFNWFEEQLEELGIARDIYIEDVFEFLKKADIEIRSSRDENNTDIYDDSNDSNGNNGADNDDNGSGGNDDNDSDDNDDGNDDNGDDGSGGNDDNGSGGNDDNGSGGNDNNGDDGSGGNDDNGSGGNDDNGADNDDGNDDGNDDNGSGGNDDDGSGGNDDNGDDGSDGNDDNGSGGNDNDYNDSDDNNGDDNDSNDEEKNPFDIKRYHRYNDILSHLRDLQAKYQDTTTRVELVEFGVTDQNRPLVYMKVTNNNNLEDNKEKPIVLIEAAINPRDWITIPAALNVLENILKEQKYLEDLEWIVIPVLNPDGYEYTHTNLRLWQKSRSTNSHLGLICPGVNINRNFDLDWLHFDSSSSPCSHVYGGTNPFSEIETQMIQSLIEQHGTRIKLYISLQNNGGYISYPWNYEKAASGMFRQHYLLGLDMIKTMNDAYNLDVGSVIFDRASGTSSDYARDKEILYTFNIDVVHSEDGVLIPEENIGGIVEDIWKAVSVAADEMIRLYS